MILSVAWSSHRNTHKIKYVTHTHTKKNMLATWPHQDEPNKAFLSDTPSPDVHISICFWSSSGCLHLVAMALSIYTNNKQGKNCCPFPDNYYLEFQAKCLGVQLCTPEMVRQDKSKLSSLHFESGRLIFF